MHLQLVILDGSGSKLAGHEVFLVEHLGLDYHGLPKLFDLAHKLVADELGALHLGPQAAVLIAQHLHRMP